MKKLFIIPTSILTVFIFYGCNKIDSTALAPAMTEESYTHILNPKGIELTNTEAEMIEEINKIREENKRSMLEVCEKLMDGAREQARLIQINKQDFNIDKDIDEITISNSEGYFESFMETLKNDSTYMVGILKPEFTCIGVAHTHPGHWVLRFK